MSNFSHQRSLATELTTFYLENKTRAVLVINGLSSDQSASRCTGDQMLKTLVNCRTSRWFHFAEMYSVSVYSSSMRYTAKLECLAQQSDGLLVCAGKEC